MRSFLKKGLFDMIKLQAAYYPLNWRKVPPPLQVTKLGPILSVPSREWLNDT